MAQVNVRVEYRLQYETQPDSFAAADVAVADNASDAVLWAAARAVFWATVGAGLAGSVTACLILRVLRPGQY
jgi:hypothetical protein